MGNEDEITTIAIKKGTRNKLQRLKIYPRETYDDLLNRLIKKEKRVDNNGKKQY